MYLNTGQFLLGVAVPGIDTKALNEEIGCAGKGLIAITAIALGYRASSNYNDPAKTPKSRLSFEEIMKII